MNDMRNRRGTGAIEPKLGASARVPQEDPAYQDRRIGQPGWSPERDITRLIDAAQTEIIVRDIQNGFGTKGGMFGPPAETDISKIERALARPRKYRFHARRAGMKVVYLQMRFRPPPSYPPTSRLPTTPPPPLPCPPPLTSLPSLVRPRGSGRFRLRKPGAAPCGPQSSTDNARNPSSPALDRADHGTLAS